MAINEAIGGDDTLFLGEDIALKLKVCTKDPVLYPYDGTDDNAKAVDMTGWTVKLDVRPRDSSPDAAILVAKTATITGTFNEDPDVSTMFAVVTLTDTETAALNTKTRRYSWKRDDGGVEKILRFGDWTLQRATQI